MTSPTTHIDTTSIVIVLPTIPPSPDYTPASDMESDPSEDPSSGHIPPLPATSPFLSSTNDSSDSDIPDIPQSPTHGTPFTKTTLSTQRKRVGPLPTHSLAVRHSVDYSSSDHFSLDDSSSSSSLETSSDSPVDVLSNSASSRSSSDHSLPASPSALSSTRTDLLPSPKRIRSPELATDLEGCSEDSFESYVPREARLRVDVGISRNYVRKFLRALHPKWRAKVTTIEESKDLSSLALDELIGNLKVHEVVMEKDSKIYRGKGERVKSIALKAKKESSDDETSTSGSDDEEYAMAVRNFRRKGKLVRQPREEKKSYRKDEERKRLTRRNALDAVIPNHLIGDCPKPPRNKDQKAFIRGSWSDSENDAEDKTNDETCLGFDSSKASTSGTKPMSFVRSSADNATDVSIIKVHRSTIPGSVNHIVAKKVAEHIFSPPMSSRSDFVITRKKLIHNRIEESKKPSLKPSLV
ncbi:hypothetical protein Tco_0437927 [Tanacetum coccineum]